MNDGMDPKRGGQLVDWSPPRPARDWKWLLFSFEGRISRAEYWRGSLYLILIWLAIGIVLGLGFSLTAYTGGIDPQAVTPILAIAVGLMMIPLLWASVGLALKRIHDRGKSGYWMLIALVPYLGAVWGFIEWGCLAGTTGPNAYGPDPLVD